MNVWLLLAAWVLAHVAQAALSVAAWREPPDQSGRRRLASLKCSLIVSLVPVASLLAFVMIFVIGGGSNVAQIAGERGMDLWSLWVDLWLPLYLGTLVAVVGGVILAILPPFPPRRWWSTLARLCGVGGALLAAWFLAEFAPTA